MSPANILVLYQVTIEYALRTLTLMVSVPISPEKDHLHAQLILFNRNSFLFWNYHSQQN